MIIKLAGQWTYLENVLKHGKIPTIKDILGSYPHKTDIHHVVHIIKKTPNKIKQFIKKKM